MLSSAFGSELPISVVGVVSVLVELRRFGCHSPIVIVHTQEENFTKEGDEAGSKYEGSSKEASRLYSNRICSFRAQKNYSIYADTPLL